MKIKASDFPSVEVFEKGARVFANPPLLIYGSGPFVVRLINPIRLDPRMCTCGAWKEKRALHKLDCAKTQELPDGEALDALLRRIGTEVRHPQMLRVECLRTHQLLPSKSGHLFTRQEPSQKAQPLRLVR